MKCRLNLVSRIHLDSSESSRPNRITSIYPLPLITVSQLTLNTSIVQSLNVLMKRNLFLLGILAILAVTVTSCASVKKDCQGTKHYRLKNGIYL